MYCKLIAHEPVSLMINFVDEDSGEHGLPGYNNIKMRVTMRNHHFLSLKVGNVCRQPRSLVNSEEKQQDEGKRWRKGWTQNGRGAG